MATRTRKPPTRPRQEERAAVPPELLNPILRALNPCRVILFGSHARGTADADSDWDLLIVVDDDLPAERIGWRALYEARRGFAGPVDLLPCRASVFRERLDVVGSLPWLAARDGVMVYERRDAG